MKRAWLLRGWGGWVDSWRALRLWPEGRGVARIQGQALDAAARGSGLG